MATITIGRSYRFRTYDDSKYLNILTSGDISNNKNVTTYALDTADMAQVWICEAYSGLGVSGNLMKSAKNSAYALDRYRGSSNYDNADIYTVGGTAADLKDQLVEFKLLSNGLYRIKLMYEDLYLTVSTTATYGGYNVRWQAMTGNTDQLWAAESTVAEPVPEPVPSAILNQTFYVQNFNTGFNLNVHGTDAIAQGRNVNVYKPEKVAAQRWIAKQTPSGGKLFSSLNELYALNIYEADNNNCTMYTSSGNDPDSLLEFIPYDAGNRIYRIKMFNHNKYLTALSVGSGANAYWTENINDYTLWKFATEAEAFPPPPAVPAAIVNKTFFIKNNNTNMYLNVYGSNTVANGRNVNIYEAENCLAQRWVARESGNGGKLHTKIDEAFALNIDSATNNCTMYTASGNDNDSVLEFSSYNASENLYLIKMHNYDKYLTAEDDGHMANVYWADIEEGSTIWKFVDESDVEFGSSEPGSAFTKDSPLVTKVIPAHTSNFTANRSGQGSTIDKITIHHMAGNLSIDTLGDIWQREGRNGSSHYGVNGTQIGQYVKESDIAWTDGNWESNKRSVTIETANSTMAPTWEIGTATYNTLIKLVADIARRNNLVPLKLPIQNAEGKWVEIEGTNLTWHSMYAATACPGPDLLRLMSSIASEANKLINEGSDEAVYIRKRHTKYFLGVNASNELTYVTASNAKKWVLKGTNGQFAISDFNNPSLKLQLEETTSTLKLAAVSTSSALAYGIVNDGLKIFVNKASSQTLALEAKNVTIGSLVALIDNLKVLWTNITNGSNATSHDIQSDTSTPDEIAQPSSIPSDLTESAYRIKNMATGKYLTLKDTIHSSQEGNIVRCENKKFADGQTWRIINFSDAYKGLISGYPEGYLLKIETMFNNCTAGNEGGYDYLCKNISIAKTDAGYKIKMETFDLYLTAMERGGEIWLYWANETDSASQLWDFELSDDYIMVDGWLRLYTNPYKNENASRKVLIPSSDPNRPSSVPYAEPYTGPDGLHYEFSNDNYWYSWQPKISGGNGINEQAQRVITELTGSPATIKDGPKGCIVDEKGSYWVSVGPNVTYLEQLPNEDIIPDNIYCRGQLDAVVIDDNGAKYYIRCVVGDVKTHTYPNGVVQTWKQFPFKNIIEEGEFQSYATSDYNGQVCVEFIGDFGSNFNIPSDELGKFSMKEILFYSN